MKFSISAAGLLAMASSVLAQTAGFDPVTSPAENQKISAGSNFKITWTAPAQWDGEKITISLIGGATQNTQVPLMDLATGVDNKAGSYSWAVDSSLGTEKVYGLVLKLESNPDTFQYSFPFHITKSSGGNGGDAASSGYGDDTGSSGYGSPTSTMHTNHGAVTVTLSSCTTSTTPVITTTARNTTTSCSTPVHQNTTMTYAPPPPTTIVTSTPIVEPPPTETPSTIPTNTPGAAAKVGSSSLAFVGALLVAALAL